MLNPGSLQPQGPPNIPLPGISWPLPPVPELFTCPGVEICILSFLSKYQEVLRSKEIEESRDLAARAGAGVEVNSPPTSLAPILAHTHSPRQVEDLVSRLAPLTRTPLPELVGQDLNGLTAVFAGLSHRMQLSTWSWRRKAEQVQQPSSKQKIYIDSPSLPFHSQGKQAALKQAGLQQEVLRGLGRVGKLLVRES